MVAQPRVSDRLESNVVPAVMWRLFLAVTLAAVGMLLVLALWLVVRRVAGRLEQPLSFPLLVTVGLVLAGSVSLVRVVWYRNQWCPRQWESWAVLRWTFPSIVVFMLASSLSIAGTGTARLLAFWSSLVVVEGFWWVVAWRRIRAVPAPRGAPRSEEDAGAASTSRLAASAPMAADPTDAITHPQDDGEQLSEDLSQQITRSRAEEENDTVVGLLRARFAPKERSRSLHVAFCPPMPHRPAVSMIQVSGPRARIKAAEVRAFGIRFDVRLSVASEDPEDALIHFQAQCGQPESGGDEAGTRPTGHRDDSAAGWNPDTCYTDRE
ncbi:MAG: hypothetical protein ACQESR_11245 [Planctomycetota bacterium]